MNRRKVKSRAVNKNLIFDFHAVIQKKKSRKFGLTSTGIVVFEKNRNVSSMKTGYR